mmetsp:Transcript_33432/g.72331  ORF Transcript_33432/g.72331 Transcript_33432/m.72331 type:complete len:286 (-) Transcript_33432:276-1133(-)
MMGTRPGLGMIGTNFSSSPPSSGRRLHVSDVASGDVRVAVGQPVGRSSGGFRATSNTTATGTRTTRTAARTTGTTIPSNTTTKISPATTAATNTSSTNASTSTTTTTRTSRPGMIGINFSSSPPSSARHLSPNAAGRGAGAAAAGRGPGGSTSAPTTTSGSPRRGEDGSYTVHERHTESWQRLHDMFEKNQTSSVPKLLDSPYSSPRSSHDGYAKSKARVGEIDCEHIKSVRELTLELDHTSSPGGAGERRGGGSNSNIASTGTSSTSGGNVDMTKAPQAPALAQ